MYKCTRMKDVYVRARARARIQCMRASNGCRTSVYEPPAWRCHSERVEKKEQRKRNNVCQYHIIDKMEKTRKGK